MTCADNGVTDAARRPDYLSMVNVKHRPLQRVSRPIRIAGWLVLAILPLALLELLAWAYLVINRDNHPDLLAFPLDEYIAELDPAKLKAFDEGQGSYRPDDALGWVHRESSQHRHGDWTLTILDDGSRAPAPAYPVRVAVFGDSFTEGSEVDDAQTWPRHLEDELGVGVKNFGVSGYGPDQAALLALQQLDGGLEVDVLVLALSLENMNRLLTTFRPFYTWPHLDWGYGLKPRFVPAGGRFDLRRFMPEDWSSMDAVSDAIRAAAAYDWYLARRILEVQAPFTRHAWPVLRAHGLFVKTTAPWQTPLAHQTLAYVVQKLARNPQGIPVVLVILPATPQDWRQPKPFPEKAEIIQSGVPVLDIRPDLPPGENYFRRVHYSPEGNAAVANAIANALRDFLLQ